MIALVILLAVLGFAVARPRGLPEAAGAVPAAVLVVALGLAPWRLALHEIGTLGPTVGFLAAILVLAHLADADGVFRYAGVLAGRLSRGSPRRLLGVVFAMAAAVTAVLSLDATVVLLTPVVFATAATVGARPRPHVYACTHLANAGSLLLPVSNLTNLLAFAASGLSFGRFAGAHGGAVAGRGGRRVRGVPPVLRRGPGYPGARGTAVAAAGAGVRAGRARAGAGRVRGRRAAGRAAGLGGAGRCGGAGRPAGTCGRGRAGARGGGESGVPGVRPGARRGGARGTPWRPGRAGRPRRTGAR